MVVVATVAVVSFLIVRANDTLFFGVIPGLIFFWSYGYQRRRAASRPLTPSERLLGSLAFLAALSPLLALRWVVAMPPGVVGLADRVRAFAAITAAGAAPLGLLLLATRLLRSTGWPQRRHRPAYRGRVDRP